jgi:hypothetical protein
MSQSIDRLNATMDRLCAANPDSPMARIRAATMAARKRTGDDRIGTNVKQGAYVVCLVTYAGKRTIVDTLASGLSVDGTVAYLNTL